MKKSEMREWIAELSRQNEELADEAAWAAHYFAETVKLERELQLTQAAMEDLVQILARTKSRAVEYEKRWLELSLKKPVSTDVESAGKSEKA